MKNAQEENIRVYKEYYSTFAKDYEKRTKEGARKIAETIINWIDLSDLQILDLGVGTGSVWEELYKKGISNVRVVGLDIAPGALKIAKEKHIPWLEVVEKKAEDSDYINCFDLVCTHGLLKHCANPKIIGEKAYNALKKDGLLFYDDSAYEDQVLVVLRRFATKAREYLKPRRKTSFGMPDLELLHMIERVGFSLRRHETYTYKTRYRSMEQLKEFFIDKTIFGIYTFKTIPVKHQKVCEEILIKTMQKEIEKPLLTHTRLICLFSKM